MYAVSCSPTLSRLSRGFSSLRRKGSTGSREISSTNSLRKDEGQETSPCSSCKVLLVQVALSLQKAVAVNALAWAMSMLPI